MLLALIDRWSDLGQGLDPARVLHQYPDLLLVRCAAADDPIVRQALERLPSDLPVHVNGRTIAVPAGAFDPVQTPRAVLRFFGPLAPQWLERLEASGARIDFRCPRFGLCVAYPQRLDAAALRAALPALAGWVPYDFSLCGRALSRTAGPIADAPRTMPDWTDIVCFTTDDRAAVAGQLAAEGVPILAESRYKLRARVGGDLDDLRRIRGVKLADGARTPILAGAHPDVARAPSVAPTGGVLAPGLDGAGEIIAVADTGLDRGSQAGALHPDFQGRVRALVSWPLNPAWDPYVLRPGADDGGADRSSGHGTHVAGLALGDGRRGGGLYPGMAPAAQLVFQAIEQYAEVRPEYRAQIPSGYYLNGRPLDLRDLFEQARALGARIHVNAWGDPAAGQYTDDCFEADLFLWQHPDALVLFAAGNGGTARNGGQGLDSGSLYAPAAGKNVIAVGATEGPRAGVGYRGTWSGFDQDGQRFPNPALAGRTVSGNPERIALFSSTGPSRDGRIKPDLCAPGTNLAAPKTQASTARGWGLASPLPYYMYFGGTSMAVGVAGGAAALLRQAWTRARGTPPSGPAQKALLLFGAKPVLAADGISTEPRHVAGFGRLDLDACLPDGPAAPLLLDRAQDGLQTGATLELKLTLAADQWFSAVLAWYDYPGETLINDLDLCLLDGAGEAVWGNHSAGLYGVPDRRNTVERISLRIGAAGSYRLRVIAVNVPNGPQGFALAYSAGLCAPEVVDTGGGAGADHGPAPSGRPPLPAHYIKGIGDTYAQRLAAAEIADLRALLTMSQDRLGTVLGLHGAPVRRVAARLDALRNLPAERLGAAPPGLTLADITRGRRPTGMEATAWDALNAALQPLADVFDRDRQHEVLVLDLRDLMN